VALVALAIYSMAELELHQRLLTQAVQVAAVLVIAAQAVTQQVTQAVLAVTVAAVAAVLTTQAHQVLVATAYFIFTTKENKCLHLQ
jgi:hypothetical protein